METLQRTLTPIWDQTPAVVSIPDRELSGVRWIQCFPTSTSISDLCEPFRSNVTRFISAIKAAGGSVMIAATFRPKERAYLMHYSAAIARKEIKPEDVPLMDGVLIDWVHPTSKESIQAAAAMTKAYNIVFPPALVSNHNLRRAIDMRIYGIVGKDIVDAQGTSIRIAQHTDLTSDLFAIGASYGVLKLISDKPHWSDDGH